jgi:peptide-N4-(N-acetyl-beta-glucosaminyl)asparagine amidase
LGHNTRLVHDLTDHVWTEVYITVEDRWVHMDACENAYDTPKLYEKGWGKKLTYCFGVNTEEVVDVTKRYILNKQINLIRRKLVPEPWL